MLVHFDRATSAVELKEALETGSAEEKADAMKKVISLLLSGESMPQVFITIVRYVLPSEDHTVQKLLLLYMAFATWVVQAVVQPSANSEWIHFYDHVVGVLLRLQRLRSNSKFTS